MAVSKSALSGVKHLIAVSSGKGGVGKSTVAVNLALALAREASAQGEPGVPKVGLLDADLYGPNVPTMLGVRDVRPGIRPVGEPGKETDEILVPPTAYGMKVMSIGFLIERDQPMIWRGPMLHSALTQFCQKVDWGDLDYLVVDLPPGTGDVQLSLAQLLPLSGAVMVTTPQEVAVEDVRKAFQMWERVRVPVIGIVENMSYFKCDNCDTRHTLFGAGGGAALAERYGAPLLVELALEPLIRSGGDAGKPIVVADPEHASAQAFQELARRVIQRLSNAQTPIQIGRFN